MSWFTRIFKDDRTYDGSFAGTGKGAPPPHLRDKNLSHSGQGANSSQPTDQEGATGAEIDNAYQPDDQATTDQ